MLITVEILTVCENIQSL